MKVANDITKILTDTINVLNDTAKLILTDMSISQLAGIIRKDWTSGGKKIYFGAVPYLDAMSELNKITDNYYFDSGESVVIYFLANATTWKGEVARLVKAELNRRVKALR